MIEHRVHDPKFISAKHLNPRLSLLHMDGTLHEEMAVLASHEIKSGLVSQSVT